MSAISTVDQGFPQLESAPNSKRPADTTTESEQSTKVPRVYTTFTIDDICICVSLSSEIWQDFLKNRHAKSENNADKGRTDSVAKVRLLKTILETDSGISEGLRAAITPQWPYWDPVAKKEIKLPKKNAHSPEYMANKVHLKIKTVQTQYYALRAHLRKGVCLPTCLILGPTCMV